MKRKLLKILHGQPQNYPYGLERNYPRILESILMLWNENEIDDYFMKLLVTDRADRNGFPPNIASELMHLNMIHSAQKKLTGNKDIWQAPPEKFKQFIAHPPKEELSDAIKNNLKKMDAACSGIFKAVELGNHKALALFIKAKCNLEVCDERGWTPLMFGTFNGQDEVVVLLLESKANVNAVDLTDNSALHWAAFNSHVNCAKLLIEHHAQINAINNYGWTPLIQATVRNHAELVALLIDKGAKLDMAAKDGYTALHKAAALGYVDIVNLLLQHDAEISLRTKAMDTAEQLASKNGHTEIIELLRGKLMIR